MRWISAAVLCLATCGAQDMVLDMASEQEKHTEPLLAIYAPATDINVKNGTCKQAFHDLCGSIVPGAGAAAGCLRSKDRASKNRAKPVVERDCMSEVTQFFRSTNGDIEKYNAQLIKACKKETDPTNGVCKNFRKPIGCLKKFKDKLGDKCKDEIFAEQVEEAEDLREDAELSSKCAADITKFCKDVKPGEGRTRECLSNVDKKKRKSKQASKIPEFFDTVAKASPGPAPADSKLSKDCQGAIFEDQVERNEDIRLDPVLSDPCSAELEQFCAEVKFGEARKKKCLYENREKSGFGEVCRAKVEGSVSDQSRDYRLDFRFKKQCSADITSLCGKEKAAVDAKTEESGSVIRCMSKKLKKIKSEKCKEEVTRVTAVKEEQISADKATEDACAGDISKFCADTKARKVQGCLRDHFTSLSLECKAQEFAEIQIASQSIAMQPAMKKACRAEIKSYCSEVQEGDGQVIACLGEHRLESDVTEACSTEISKDDALTSTDWRLKFGVSHHCASDVNVVCPSEAAAASGRNTTAGSSATPGNVLECLVKKRKKISNKECRADVQELVRSQAADPQNSAYLKVVCGDDVSAFCPDIEPGHGSVSACLQSHLKKLSGDCRSAEFTVTEAETEHADLNPLISSRCRKIIHGACLDAYAAEKAGQAGALMRCLEDQINDPGTTSSSQKVAMPQGCADAVNKMTQLKNSDIRLNPELESSCAADISMHCANETVAISSDTTSEILTGRVIQCLMDHRKQIQTKECRQSVLRKQVQRTADVKNDPGESNACADDIDTFCKSFKDSARPGAVHKCLNRNLDKLSPDCKAKEFANQVMKSEDLRLNPWMSEVCEEARQKYCSKKKSDDGAIDCLITNKDKEDVSSDCYQRLEEEVIKRSKAIAFNPKLTQNCARDLGKLRNASTCGPEVDDVSCLSQNVKSLKSSACKDGVTEVQKAASEDLRALPGGGDKTCEADKSTFCKDVEEGEGRVNNCLQDHVDDLSDSCKAVQADLMKKAVTDWLLNPRLRKFCANERQELCGDIQHGEKRVITCLTNKAMNTKLQDKISDGCRSELDRLKKTKVPKIPKAAPKKLNTSPSTPKSDFSVSSDPLAASLPPEGEDAKTRSSAEIVLYALGLFVTLGLTCTCLLGASRKILLGPGTSTRSLKD